MATQTADRRQGAPCMPRNSGANPTTGEICLVSTTEQRYFRNPVQIYSTCKVEEVTEMMDAIDARVKNESLYAAGYLSYEASAAFEDAIVTHGNGSDAILWFGLYETCESTIPAADEGTGSTPRWEPSISEAEFDAAIKRIRDYIGRGDTYQVNYTFPLHADFEGDPYAWFRQLCDAQSADYCAYLDTGSHIIVSASPELFFSLDERRLMTKPMKGTIARGKTLEQDRIQRDALSDSEKDRAENIMIVDLLRNDMGRISETGSVRVESRFDVSKFDTLWQMTSTITSETDATIPEIFQALFPPGSVTGAPKIRTSEIIHELETGPRGVYCGAIGWWGPGRRSEFNVAIRTATLDVDQKKIRYPVGAGITWDSSSAAEYAECLLKAEVVTQPRIEFKLLESLLWDGEYFLLERHIARLRQSAEYFGFSMDESSVLAKLLESKSVTDSAPRKIRLLLSRHGEIEIESAPITAIQPCRVSLAHRAVCSGDVYLYHKTTNRSAYESALSGMESDDVILWNERGEITESTRANVMVKRDGLWVTPPVHSGLLAGTYRAHLLDDGVLSESVIMKEEFMCAQEICLINSVRREIPVTPVWK